jgi:hypothetical protein
VSAADIAAMASRLVAGARDDHENLSEAEMLDLITAIEQAKATLAAAQAHLSTAFAAHRLSAREAARVPSPRRGRGIGHEVALARRESPHRGSRHLALARALTAELPCTLRALERGLVSEWQATLVMRASACLSVEDRMRLDTELACDSGRCEGWGDRQLAAEAKKIAYRLDPAAVVRRARKAETDRHVSIRPAPDTMARVSALLPVAKGVAVYAALKAAADTARATGDARGKGQVMADSLVERVTGLAPDGPVPVNVDLVITDRALLRGDTEPAFLPGYDTVPSAWARELIDRAASWRTTTDEAALDPATTASARGKVRAFIRRLFTAPGTGQLIAMDSKARCFPKNLGAFIDLRDLTCRNPWCDAPIAHRDHPWAVAAGGPTTAGNSQGLCEACNYAKQAPGWRARTVLGEPRHTVETITPTGHRYRSTAPPPPGTPPGTHLMTGFTDDNMPATA